MATGWVWLTDCPVQHGADVVVIEVEPVEPGSLSVAARSSGAARDARAVNQSRWRPSTRSRLTAGGEALRGEFADGLEQPETRLPIGHRVDLDEALVHETG